MSRYRLLPTPAQEAVLRDHCAHARYVWNLAVEQHSHWHPGLTSAPGYLEQCRQLTAARAEYPWLAAGSQMVQQQALRDFTQAMAAFFDPGNPTGRPSWRKAGRDEGFRIVAVKPGQVRRLSRKTGEVWVPKAGWVRFRWSRPVPPGAKSYRVTTDRAGRWHIAFAVIPEPIPAPGNGQAVGIDRGVTVSAALSTGELLHAPGLTGRERRRMRRLQRKLARARRGSNRRGRVKHAIARLRARETDRRTDWAEKASTGIARRFDLIRVEDLKIGNMTRSARGTARSPGRNVRAKAGLNREILASGWGLLVRRLADKAPGRVEKITPAFTSQRCSACGQVDANSRESQARFACTACGYACNADVNAARNIAAGHAVTARGGFRDAGPVIREPQLLASLTDVSGWNPPAFRRREDVKPPAWQTPSGTHHRRASCNRAEGVAVTMARPGRCAIVTTAAEPRGGRRRHNGMLSTPSLNRQSARTRRTRFGAAAGLAVGGAMLAGGLLLAGCSGSSSSSASASAAQAEAVPSAAGAAPAGGVAASGSAKSAAGQRASTGTTARLAPASDIIYTAQLTVRAQNVSSAAAKAAQITEGVGGYVSNETTSANPDHPSEATATVQLKIPVASYPPTLGQLAGSLGTQLSLQQQAQDVTEQVADVNSQVASYQAAIAQLRALLSHAGSVGDLLSVQNQINNEESALEALQAQQRALSHETSYATVTLTILGPKAKPAAHRPKAPPSLAGGLGAGWHALKVSLSWTLAFLGAIAPFAAIAAIAAYAIYRARRWMSRRRPAPRPAAPEN